MSASNAGSFYIILSRVHYNSEYDANYGSAEYVEVKNISGQTVILKDWELQDYANPNQRYRVPDDFFVEPG